MPHFEEKPIAVLMVTGIYPTEQLPHKGTFIKSQIDSLITAGIEIEIIHPKPGSVLLRYATAILQVFLKTLKGQFDIVHGHYGLWCLVARLQWTTPVVASFLGSDLLGDVTTHGYSKFGKLVVVISRWLCRRVDAVIVKSEEMKNRALEDAIFVIPNGVDFESFHPIPRAEARAALGWTQDYYYVLFAGNPRDPRKNFPLAQAAIECLNNRGISVQLKVANGLPQTKVVQYINASNALILPSIHEGSPNIVKETMACNVPVVSVDVGDVSEVIGHTQGCKVCQRDANELASALQEAIQFEGPTTGRDDIAHLACSVVANRIIAVYESVIREKAKGKPNTSLLRRRGRTPA